MAIAVGFAIIYPFAAELFPTVVRSLVMGLCSTGARIGGIIAPMVILLGSQSIVI